MTPEEISNERLKLAGTWLNGLSVAIMTAGSFIPSAQFVFGILPETAETGLVYISAVVCVLTGLSLHSVAQWLFGGLE